MPENIFHSFFFLIGGTQFGLLQYGLDRQWVSDDELSRNPIAKLLEVYIRANAEAEKDPNVAQEARNLFQKLEAGNDDSLLAGWSRIKEWTVSELTRMYSRLGVHFDEFNWESQYGIQHIKAVLDALEKAGHLETDGNGKRIVRLSDKKSVTLVKSDGSSLVRTI